MNNDPNYTQKQMMDFLNQLQKETETKKKQKAEQVEDAYRAQLIHMFGQQTTPAPVKTYPYVLTEQDIIFLRVQGIDPEENFKS